MLVKCLTCGKEFNKPNWALRRSGHNFCEYRCYAEWRKAFRLQQFLKRVQKTETCWLWLGGKTKGGYGQTRVFNRRTGFAHRLSWMLFRGPIPKGMMVLHNCPDGDNPSCVNPDHLWLGTHADNMQDAVRKGRKPWGEKHPKAKLFLSDIHHIIQQHHLGVLQKTLAANFGVARSTITAVISKHTWKRAHPIK